MLGPLATLLLDAATLRRVVLSHNPLGSEGVRALAATALRKHTSLQSVELRGCGVGEGGMKAVCAALQACNTTQRTRPDTRTPRAHGMACIAPAEPARRPVRQIFLKVPFSPP